MSDEQEEIFEFPCEFPIKAVGKDSGTFSTLVVDIIGEHVTIHEETQVKTQASGKGKYLSVTVTITAESRAQLDAIYMSLTGHPEILMAL